MANNSNSQDRKMIIEHTTYDACHSVSRPSPRPTSATKRVKDYFSKRISESSDQGPSSPRPGADRPGSNMTMWPQAASAPAEVEEKRRPERRRERSSKHEAKPTYKPTSAAIGGLYAREEDPPRRHRRRHHRRSPRRDPVAGDGEIQGKQDEDTSKSSLRRSDTVSEPSTRQQSSRRHASDAKAYEPAPPVKPTLRRQPGLASFVREAFTGKPAQEVSNTVARKKVKLEKIQEVRTAMRDGWMERAIPPSRGTSTDRRPPPCPSSGNPFLDRTSAKSSARNSKHSSTSSKLVDIIRTSADMMDETRRDLAEKFRPPFEHLSYSRSRSRRRSSTVSTTDSELSFCCAGEKEKEKDAKDVKVGARLSGEGNSLWVGRKLEKCRLCKDKVASGGRGLCRECESDFMRPKTPPPPESDSSESSWTSKYEVSASGSENEEKPVPPPKDERRFLSARNEERKPSPGREDRKPPPRDEHLVPKKQHPHLVFTGKEKERQTPEMEMQAGFARSPRNFSDWSSDRTRFDEGGDSAEGEIPPIRDTEFYGFYDGLLDQKEERGRSRPRGRQLER